MYLSSTLQRGLIIAGIALLVVVVVIAVTHRSTAPAQAEYANPNGYTTPAPLNSYGAAQVGTAGANGYAQTRYPAPANSGYSSAGYADRDDANGYAAGANPPAGYAAGNSYYPSRAVYAASPYGSEMMAEPAPPPPPAPVAVHETSPAPLYGPEIHRRYYYRHGRRYVIEERRPFSHSAAIVGGGAAGGAAIGALAGGGEGAAIGALAGGAGGFVYDRLTHKKKVVVER